MVSTSAIEARSLGVLGGMGPAATADFLVRLAALTSAAIDQDHAPIIVYSDPQTPDRSDAILGMGPSPLPAMTRGIHFLNRAGCALIAIPCNTAHYWYEQLVEQSATPILHIADAVIDHLRRLEGTGTVGILATDGTIRSGIYQDRLLAAGFATVDLTDMGKTNLAMRGIREMKSGRGRDARQTLTAGARELTRRGAGAVLIACTDASAALADVTELNGTPVIDASTCLARVSLEKLGKRSL
jgi:aspartate racemase